MKKRIRIIIFLLSFVLIDMVYIITKKNENTEQNKEYVIIKMSSEVLYPTCIKCLCQPILENENNYDKDGNITYGQQSITADDENYSFINSEAEVTIF